VNIKYSANQLATLPFPVDIRNQNWAIISYVGPNTIPASAKFSIRIYGTFHSQKEADDACDEAQGQGYTIFDLCVVDIGHGFFPLPPPEDDDVPYVEYADKVLDGLMRKHKSSAMSGNNRITKRSEAELDTRTPAKAFDDMVTEEAKRLFEEWKEAGEIQQSEEELHNILQTCFKKKIDAKVKEAQAEGEEKPVAEDPEDCCGDNASSQEADENRL
jgi:hypothetical protein